MSSFFSTTIMTLLYGADVKMILKITGFGLFIIIVAHYIWKLWKK